MIAQCRTCVYFSSSMNGACLRFGKKFVDGFYSALECRNDETKCGYRARCYLEKLGPKKSNAPDVHDSGAYGVGR
jgi:hypothetical protein